jgi:ribonuclease D
MSDWIEDAEALQRTLAGVQGVVGLDTEFMRERTYWPQLALVQIALPDGRILLVDAAKPALARALVPLLQDPAVTKVMHSASEDLVALNRACGVLPEPLFDTQIAAALAGIGAGLGYQKLVLELTATTLDKTETRSDWLQRPLSPRQLAYAADDVRHLHVLHHALLERLDALARRAWLDEDCARLVAQARDDTDPWPHLAIRAAQYLDGNAQRRLLRLLRWRDQQARHSDRPRSWVLDPVLAVALAKDPPADVAALQAALDATPKAPRKLTEALWRALDSALPDETDAPLARADDGNRQQLRRLQDVVAEQSRRLGLPDGVLASRRMLEALLELGAAPATWPRAMAGWRRRELEPHLAPLLA